MYGCYHQTEPGHQLNVRILLIPVLLALLTVQPASAQAPRCNAELAEFNKLEVDWTVQPLPPLAKVGSQEKLIMARCGSCNPPVAAMVKTTDLTVPDGHLEVCFCGPLLCFCRSQAILQFVDAFFVKRVLDFRSQCIDIARRGGDSAYRLPYPAGLVAAAALKNIIGDRPVTCEPKAIDRYGRTVALCRAGGEDLGEAMVKSGMAYAFVRYSKDYVATEDQARSERIGLHIYQCDLPWEWRARNRGDR